jgi:hypothetical protein
VGPPHPAAPPKRRTKEDTMRPTRRPWPPSPWAWPWPPRPPPPGRPRPPGPRTNPTSAGRCTSPSWRAPWHGTAPLAPSPSPGWRPSARRCTSPNWSAPWHGIAPWAPSPPNRPLGPTRPHPTPTWTCPRPCWSAWSEGCSRYRGHARLDRHHPPPPAPGRRRHLQPPNSRTFTIHPRRPREGPRCGTQVADGCVADTVLSCSW